MPDIVLTTLNAKFIHAAFGLRYLLANLGPLKASACLVEFDIHQRPVDVAEVLLAREPKIIGFGVYIWNVAQTTEVVAALKRVRPEVVVVLGGPEVSYEVDQQPIVQLADYVITGEADLKFAEVSRQLLAGRRPANKIIAAELPEMDRLDLPYDLYSDQDIAHRIIYVEASRGCPFTCEFCLSSLDIPVRQVPLDKLLGHLQRLLERGVKHFKFVDRTFNLNLQVSRALLQFFLERLRPDVFLHFEMIPDRLPEGLREVIARFPPGALQFEVGIQSFNEEVCRLIRRRQNLARLEDNLRFLRERTGVHVHADLIAGLPGETLESFAAGFDRLVALGPQEIQVCLLKRLRGTPIVRHDAEWQMVYSPHPPYEILQTRLIRFADVQRLRRFARYWDLVANSGNFVETTPLLWSAEFIPQAAQLHARGGMNSALRDSGVRPSSGAATSPRPESSENAKPAHSADVSGPEDGRTTAAPSCHSPFAGFMRFTEWLFVHVGRTDGIALIRLAELLFQFLTEELELEREAVARTLWRDYQRGGRRDQPAFLRPYLSKEDVAAPKPVIGPGLKRQARHSLRV